MVYPISKYSLRSVAVAILLPLPTRASSDAISPNDFSGTWDFTLLGDPQATVQVPGGGWKLEPYFGGHNDLRRQRVGWSQLTRATRHE